MKIPCCANYCADCDINVFGLERGDILYNVSGDSCGSHGEGGESWGFHGTVPPSGTPLPCAGATI